MLPTKETGVVIQRQWLYTQVLPTQGDWSGHPETVAIHTSVAHSRRLEWSSRDSGYTHKCCPLKETGVVIQRQWLYTQVLPTQGDWSGHPETVAIHTSVAHSRRLEWSSRDSGYTHKCCPPRRLKQTSTERQWLHTSVAHQGGWSGHLERDSGYTQVLPTKEAGVDIHRETVATRKCCPPRRLEWTPRARQWLHTSVAHQGGWSGHLERDSGYTQVLPTKEAGVDIHRETVATRKCCPPRRLEWTSRERGNSMAAWKSCMPMFLTSWPVNILQKREEDNGSVVPCWDPSACHCWPWALLQKPGVSAAWQGCWSGHGMTHPSQSGTSLSSSPTAAGQEKRSAVMKIKYTNLLLTSSNQTKMQIHISLIPWLSRQTLQSSNWIPAACTAPNPKHRAWKTVAGARKEFDKGWLYLRGICSWC